ncbi:MAG: endonuclease/exonuclease/phosphatase family protein [Lentisphaeraceae bacterium]|nr:endonuclease/exonuclease/phosphatase family protein [Lentisphaeraceae bacterium]
MVLNVYKANEDKESVIDFIKSEGSDFVGLIEIDYGWENAILSKLSKIYPYNKSIHRSDNFGMMLLSKKPFESNVHKFQQIPFIEAKFGHYTVWLAHPLPPISKEYLKRRDLLLAELSTLIDPAKNNLICGDFNAVPWAQTLTKLKDENSLKNCADGYGINNTWPAHISLPGIQIDHFFISKHANIINFKRGPYLGSDHYPILLEFSFGN